jgi:hypothetical protein
MALMLRVPAALRYCRFDHRITVCAFSWRINILDAPDILSTLGEILSWTPKVNAIIQEKTLFLTTGIID